MSTSLDTLAFYTPPQVAKRLQVSPERVIAWIRAGKLRAVNLSDGTIRPRFRIHADDLDSFLRAREVIASWHHGVGRARSAWRAEQARLEAIRLAEERRRREEERRRREAERARQRERDRQRRRASSSRSSSSSFGSMGSSSRKRSGSSSFRSSSRRSAGRKTRSSRRSGGRKF